MQEIPKSKILRRIALENPWWEPPHRAPEKFTRWTPRPYIKLFYPLVNNLRIRRAPVLMGPRRVGKTYLLHHCVDLLLKEGIRPQQICYISVDSPTYLNLSLERLLDLYAEAAKISYLENQTYVFFDEIQYLRNWEQHLKSLVDSFPLVQVVASGSAAAALRLKSRESGAGRFTDFLLPPLTFYEYLELINEESYVQHEARDDASYYSTVEIEELNRRFEDYVNFGGYPEVAISQEIRENPERFIKSDIIDKVLLRDLPSLYGISDIQELNSLFTSLAFNTGQEIALEELARHSGVAKPTIKRYIEYLEAAFLVRVIHRIDEGAKRFKRARNFKVYLTNPSLRTALFGSTSAREAAFGLLVETAVFAQWLHSEGESLHYARWKQGELDFVSLLPNQQVQWAAEIKWMDRFAQRPSLMKPVLSFCLKNNVRQIVATTRSLFGKHKISNVEIQFWPAALYSFAVGHSLINSRVLALEAATI